MSKYSKGQTSDAKAKEKEEKSQSLLTKVLLIKKANADKQKIGSLNALSSSRGVSFKAALSWADQDLGVTPCAYNTAQKPYNVELSDSLKSELQLYNQRISTVEAADQPQLAKKTSDKQRLAEISSRCDYLMNALAEVYRAYKQLEGRVDEKTRQDIRYQQVVKSHARALGKANLILVKA